MFHFAVFIQDIEEEVERNGMRWECIDQGQIQVTRFDDCDDYRDRDYDRDRDYRDRRRDRARSDDGGRSSIVRGAQRHEK